jgi:hypothetical protein
MTFREQPNTIALHVLRSALRRRVPSLIPMPGLSVDAQREKLGGYQFYRDVLGSPIHVVAPMVDQSELVSQDIAASSEICIDACIRRHGGNSLGAMGHR